MFPFARMVTTDRIASCRIDGSRLPGRGPGLPQMWCLPEAKHHGRARWSVADGVERGELVHADAKITLSVTFPNVSPRGQEIVA